MAKIPEGVYTPVHNWGRTSLKPQAQPIAVDFAETGSLPVPEKRQPANDNAAGTVTAKPKYPGIVSSGELVRDFVPPDYHLDGISQAGFLYSTTAMTGTGKTAILLLLSAITALGGSLGDREVKPGRVLYFAGENPQDVTMRWIAMSHNMEFDPEDIDVHFIKGTFSIIEMFERIKADVARLGGVSMIVIDTSAAYFQGAEENSNTELGKFARELRQLTTLKGNPVVYVAAHPIKNADVNNLLPRGGGAFLGEVDGNLVLVKGDAGVKLHWHGKHRGPDFDPVMFDLSTVTAPALIDSKGRDIPTVMASAMSKGEVREKIVSARKDEDEILLMIEIDGKQSLYDMAKAMGWLAKNGVVQKRRAVTAANKLKSAKLATCDGRSNWTVTPKGFDELVKIKAARHRSFSSYSEVANMG
jgi:hypothetical protein